MRNPGRWLPLLLLLSMIGAARAQVMAAPRWPLDIESRYLTSNFMEYRDGRFHAGIDLKTNSRCGYVCRAVEDGWIARIKVSPGGYGRALYLRGESGRTFVYAHLDRLAAPWREIVGEAQRKAGGWSVDLSFPPGRWPVTAGDALALSGESGTNGPHLHFEVRDGAQRPLNPFAVGFAAVDTIAPVIERVRILPAEPGAMVAGSASGVVITAGDGAGLPDELSAVPVDGAISLSASIIDHSDIRGHRLEAWRISLTIDGETAAEWRNDRFDFATQSTMRLEWFEYGGLRERRLHLLSGNRLDGRRGERDGPRLDLAPGRHRVGLEAEDFGGNRSGVEWDLLVAVTDSTSVERSPAWRPDTLGVRLPPDELGRSRRLIPSLVLTRCAEGRIESAWAADVARAEVGRGGRVIAGGPGSGLQADAVCWLVAEAIADGGRCARQGLRPLGGAFRVIAAEWMADGGPKLALPGVKADSLDAATAVYRFDERKGRWKWAADAEVGAKGGPVEFVAAKPGLYAVMRDVAAPRLLLDVEEIDLLRSSRRERGGIAPPYWEPIALPVVEEGAGLLPDACRARLDGKALLVEVDLPRDRLLLELPALIYPGLHRLEIEIGDGAMHVAKREVLVLVPPTE